MTDPFPLYTSEPIGTLEAKDGRQFSVVAGLDHTLVRKLRERSLDEWDTELQQNTSDRTRFGEGSYEEWYGKNRYPFALLSSDRDLAGLIWFGPSPLPGSEGQWDTIAFRSYPPYRGIGLMGAFGRLVIKEHEKRFPERSLWLETDADNEAGLALYQKLGFSEHARIKSGARVVMIKD